VEYLRSVLSTPGQRQRMIDKVYNGLDPEPDGVIFDLEDAVPPDLKDQARTMVAEVIRRAWRPNATARFVRVNGSPEERLVEDIRAIVHPGLNGITIPKVERPEDVLFVDRLVSALEPGVGLAVGTIRLLISIESAKGLLRAYDILSCSPRILGVFLGAEDYSLDLGLPVTRSGAGQEALFARSTIVVAAAASRIFSIDQGYVDFHDLDALRRAAKTGRELGFTGSWCIHPDQVAVVNEIYSPQPEEVDLARRVVKAFDDAKRQGLGAVMMGGQFVEIPIVERAQRTLRLHEKLEARKRALSAAR